MMDDLTYTYDAGNKLTKVEDIASLEGFKNGANTPTEYTYDPNGNMLSDANKEGGALRKCPVDIFSERASLPRGRILPTTTSTSPPRFLSTGPSMLEIFHTFTTLQV
jgi:YD repeat-containing protein